MSEKIQDVDDEESKSESKEADNSDDEEDFTPETKASVAKRGRPKAKAKCKSYQRNVENFDAAEIVEEYLYDDKDFSENRGRPRMFKSNDYNDLITEVMNKTLEEIKTLFYDHFEKISSNKKYRVDAVLTSLYRTLKKVPLKMLHYYGSKTKFKSKMNDSCLISYIEIFKKCFMVVFPECENEDLLKLFLFFISLHYPECRVRLILDSLSKSLIDDKEQAKYQNMLANVKKTSKKDIKVVYQQNSAFKIICKGVSRLVEQDTSMSQEIKEEFAKTLSKITQ